MNIEDFNELLHGTLDDDFIVLFAGEAPPSEGEIQKYSQSIDCSFPKDFTCLLSSYLNGFYVEAKEEVWPRKEGGAYWMFQYALIVYGLDSGLPDWVNMRDYVQKFRLKHNTDLTPFMRTISSSEPYCFTKEGKIVKWCNDTGASNPVNASFFETFKRELYDLKAFKNEAKRKLV